MCTTQHLLSIFLSYVFPTISLLLLFAKVHTSVILVNILCIPKCMPIHTINLFMLISVLFYVMYQFILNISDNNVIFFLNA